MTRQQPPVKGVNEAGREIELLPWQAEVVAKILDWHQNGSSHLLPRMGPRSGKTVVMATVLHELSKQGVLNGGVV